MRSVVNRAWRVAGTGFSFCVFGAAGLVMGSVVFPVVRLAVRDGPPRQRLARRIIAFSFRRFINMMRSLGLFEYDLVGFERLERSGMLLVANHPSLIDTVFLMGFVANHTCVVNCRLFDNPYTGATLRTAGYIRSDAGPQIVDDCVAALVSGDNVIIFPEGTRTPLSGDVQFKRGAANIAVRSGRSITPIVIRCVPRMLARGVKWWCVPVRPARFSLEVREDIAVPNFLAGSASPAASVRQLNAYLERYLSVESRAHDVH